MPFAHSHAGDQTLMKTVILAGGYGTRISEESSIRPKPMVEIGGKPILWHIMKIYSAHGINDFVICCGYKAYVIKEYLPTTSCIPPTSPSICAKFNGSPSRQSRTLAGHPGRYR
jgi:NDP-sugar pyrophosphorylase family protein